MAIFAGIMQESKGKDITESTKGTTDNHALGFIAAIVSSATFGLIPLFTIPVMKAGMTFQSILTYRFAFSAILLLPVILASPQRRKALRITWKQAGEIAVLAMLYFLTAAFLFDSYKYMPSGKSTTLLFMYPVYTAIIMVLFFHERFSWKTAAAIVLAVAGVAFLSAVKGTGQNQHTAALGLILILAAGLIYAVYLVAIPQTEAGRIDSLALTFYVLLFGFIYLIISTSLRAPGLQPIPDWKSGVNLLLLALVPTLISNLTLIVAVKKVGSTPTSILGAFEPLTAVCVGTLVLGEPFSWMDALGICLIISAVIILLLQNKSKKPVENVA